MKRRTFFASLFAPLLAPLLVKKAAAAPVKPYPYLVTVDFTRDCINLHKSFSDPITAEKWRKMLDHGIGGPDHLAKLDVSKNRETIYFHSQPPREAPAP